MSFDFTEVWLPVFKTMPLHYSVGDILAYKIPTNQCSIVFLIEEIDRFGDIHLISQPFHYSDELFNLVTSIVITPQKLLNQSWFYLERTEKAKLS